jgi:hypothetical protein
MQYPVAVVDAVQGERGLWRCDQNKGRKQQRTHHQ